MQYNISSKNLSVIDKVFEIIVEKGRFQVLPLKNLFLKDGIFQKTTPQISISHFL